MDVKKWLTGALAASMLTGLALVGPAGPAAAEEEGPDVAGDIFFLANAGGFDLNTAADMVTSGTGAARPFQSLSVTGTCPASAVSIQPHIRVPQAGTPESEWVQIPVAANMNTKDSEGRYFTNRGDLFTKPEAMAYLATQPGSTGTFPFIVVCRDDNGLGVGLFRTTLTMTGNATSLAWSIPAATFPGGGSGTAATTTTLTAAAAPSGTELVLTAAVSPAAAAGSVTFSEGGTPLGAAVPVSGGSASFTVPAPAQGSHTYAAAFAPTDAGAYGASTDTVAVVIGIDSATGQITVTVPEVPVVDGALTFAVPFDTPVGLLGSRSGDNTRVTASGSFPTITVTDTRRDALLTDWEVYAQATDFAGSSETIGAKYLGWTPALPTMTLDPGSPLMAQAGAAVPSFLDEDASAGLGASALLGRTATPGRGITVLNSILNLAIPGTTAQGEYTSTVTVTLVAE